MKETKPQPRVTARVCSLCGLEWELHGTKPTTETCIELLLAEVRSLNAQLAVRPYARPYPVPRPYPVYPRPWPISPYWQTTWSNTSGTGTPAISPNQPRAIAQSSSA
jgi:hypothetical protein